MNIHHPSIYLQPAWTTIIRENSLNAEKLGGLHPDQLNLIYEQQWFKLFVPLEYGGVEMPLSGAIRLQEALSWADGSLGWTVTLCSGAGWFGGFLSPDIADGIFSDPHVCLGGSGAPSGTATLTENGYRVTGQWKYATGAPHTTHFTANCLIRNGNEYVLDEHTNPLVLSFVFNSKDVAVIADWNTIGLIATGSQSFRINDLDVPERNCFKIAPAGVTSGSSIYKYPFLQFAELTLAANISGMAIHFIDLCEAIFADKIVSKNLKDYQREILSGALLQSKNALNDKRTTFYQAADQSWEVIAGNGKVSDEVLESVSRNSRELAKLSLREVDNLYPYCGLLAADPASEINRVWRDLHTASQHSLLSLPL